MHFAAENPTLPIGDPVTVLLWGNPGYWAPATFINQNFGPAGSASAPFGGSPYPVIAFAQFTFSDGTTYIAQDPAPP